jgi:hypothetical protein
MSQSAHAPNGPVVPDSCNAAGDDTHCLAIHAIERADRNADGVVDVKPRQTESMSNDVRDDSDTVFWTRKPDRFGVRPVRRA